LFGDGEIDPGNDQSSSEQTNVQQTSVDVAQFAALLENEDFVELLDRRMQSIKDRRIAKQEQQLTEFQTKLERLEQLQKQGMSRDQALDRMTLEERLAALESRESSSRPGQDVPKTSPQSASVEAFLSAVGVDFNSPQVTQYLRSGDTSPEGMVRFVTEVKGKAKPQPNPAQVAPPSTGQTPAPRDVDKINRDLATALDTVPKDWDKIKALRQELNAAIQS
jgi:TolA-binding protein